MPNLKSYLLWARVWEENRGGTMGTLVKEVCTGGGLVLQEYMSKTYL